MLLWLDSPLWPSPQDQPEHLVGDFDPLPLTPQGSSAAFLVVPGRCPDELAKGNVVLVAINKAAGATPVTIKLKNCPAGKRVAVFQLTEASPIPAPGKDLAVEAGEIRTELPSQSVSTMVVQAQ